MMPLAIHLLRKHFCLLSGAELLVVVDHLAHLGVVCAEYLVELLQHQQLHSLLLGLRQLLFVVRIHWSEQMI